MTPRTQRWQRILLGVVTLFLLLAGAIWVLLFRGASSLLGGRPLPEGKVTPQIACANGRAVLIAPDGSLWEWGMNSTIPRGTHSRAPKRFGGDSDWRKIALGSTHTVAIKMDGTLWGWGWNTHGQLGFPNTVGVVRQPQRLDPGTNWTQIRAAGLFTMALKDDGSLWTCGYNASGQIGDGTTQDRFGFMEVTGDRDWKMVATGVGNSFAIKTNGTLWIWGSDPLPAAQDYLVPTQIGTATNWAHVVASSFEVFALKTDGTLWIGGHNAKSTAPAYVAARMRGLTQIGTDRDWKEIHAGHGYYFARKEDKRWWIGGGNTWGQLGIGGGHGIIRRQELEKPETLPFEIDPWAFALAPDLPSTHLLTRDGALWSWGSRLGVMAAPGKLRPLKLGFNRFLYALSGQKISGFSLQEEAIDAMPRKLWELPETVKPRTGTTNTN